MTVSTTQNISLSLQLDGKEFNCQVINATFTMPGVATGATIMTACPDGEVSEPGSPENGSLTGQVFVDSAAQGITWVLATAKAADAELDYTLVLWPELGPAGAMKFTGRAKVSSLPLTFEKPGLAKHDLDLSIISATMARPAAV